MITCYTFKVARNYYLRKLTMKKLILSTIGLLSFLVTPLVYAWDNIDTGPGVTAQMCQVTVNYKTTVIGDKAPLVLDIHVSDDAESDWRVTAESPSGGEIMARSVSIGGGIQIPANGRDYFYISSTLDPLPTRGSLTVFPADSIDLFVPNGICRPLPIRDFVSACKNGKVSGMLNLNITYHGFDQTTGKPKYDCG